MTENTKHELMKACIDFRYALNSYDTWIVCGACGQKVTGDSIHTCSPQLKELTDEEILREWVDATYLDASQCTDDIKDFARALLRKAQEK